MFVTLNLSRRIKAGVDKKLPLKKKTLALLLVVTLGASTLASPTKAQDSAARETISVCWQSDDVSREMSDQIDKALIAIDTIASTIEMASAHLKLLTATEGRLSYCEIERRLRLLGLTTYLLALPYQDVVGHKDSNSYSITYPQQRFQTWSAIPKFAVWYERKGSAAADARLTLSGMIKTENLENLNKSGLIISALKEYPNYRIASSPGKSGLDVKYKWFYSHLSSYIDNGYLSDAFNPSIMPIIQNYIGNSKTLFSINGAPSEGLLQLYVIDKDPDRLLRGSSCNCSYFSDSNFIICDARMLQALSDWVVYGKNDKIVPNEIRILNDVIADLLLYWIVGHEIGHFVAHDKYRNSFLAFDDTKTPNLNDISDRSVLAIERRADQFAMATLPANVASWGHMATNYLIQQLVRIARKSNGNAAGEETPIRVRETESTHPNFLLRAYALMHATGSVDFLLERYERETTVDKTGGVEFPGPCSLTEH